MSGGPWRKARRWHSHGPTFRLQSSTPLKASRATRNHRDGRTAEAMEPSSWIAKRRPFAETTALTLARFSCCRARRGPAIHWKRRGGATTVSVPTALLLGSWSVWVHSSRASGHGLTVFCQAPSRRTQATPPGDSTRTTSSMATGSSFVATTRLTRPSA